MTNSAVPGGDPVVIETDGVVAAVSKVLMTGDVAAVEAGGITVSFEPGMLGGDPNADEMEKAKNFTEVKV